MKKAFDFLQDLKENNNREWFEKHRPTYEVARDEMAVLVQKILDGMKEQDVIEQVEARKSMQRIYRDVRFSKDKTPYKQHFGGKITRATKYRRGGYYFHLEPGNTFVVAAFWNPNKEDLAWIRSHIAMDAAPLDTIVNDPIFKKEFGEIEGEKLKNKPKGYEIDHPNIEWLKYKQFLVFKHFSDEEALSPNFHKKVLKAFAQMLPFLDYMSDILTTDLNGEEV